MARYHVVRSCPASGGVVVITGFMVVGEGRRNAQDAALEYRLTAIFRGGRWPRKSVARRSRSFKTGLWKWSASSRFTVVEICPAPAGFGAEPRDLRPMNARLGPLLLCPSPSVARVRAAEGVKGGKPERSGPLIRSAILLTRPTEGGLLSLAPKPGNRQFDGRLFPLRNVAGARSRSVPAALDPCTRSKPPPLACLKFRIVSSPRFGTRFYMVKLFRPQNHQPARPPSSSPTWSRRSASFAFSTCSRSGGSEASSKRATRS
jgi:hypothetical protein